MTTRLYPGDLTDKEWSRLAPLRLLSNPVDDRVRRICQVAGALSCRREP